jgi:hypothetical protein
VSPRRPVNWEDDAGTNPETGEPWSVKQMVGRAHELLGSRHGEEARRRRLDWEAMLTDSQRRQLRRAGVKRPRKHA